MKDLSSFFADVGGRVDETLEKLIPSEKDVPKRLYEAVRWSVFAGGKRFRPALCLAVGKTFDANRKKLLKTASAIEMIHTYSLIHDDLPAMDNDDLRRGRATCHKKFDEATAILAGDFLQSLAFQTIAEDKNLTEKIRVKLLAELADSAARMVKGQQLDLDGEGKKISLKNLEKIHQNKTGAMISFSARSGAIIAEANKKEHQSITIYAEKLGLLFQITDDLLDETQTTEILGKTAGKDKRAEKATYPSFYGIQKTQNLAKKIYSETVEELNKLNRNTDLLKNLAAFILNRQK